MTFQKLFLLCSILVACASGPALADAAVASSKFGDMLLAKLQEVSPTDNVFISPTSIYIALSMATNGAAGATRSELLRTLGAQSLDALDDGCKSLTASFTPQDSSITVDSANSLWINDQYTLAPSFEDLNRKFFDAHLSSVDFSNPATAGVINSWVSAQTNGKIDQLIGKTSAQDSLVLVNAVYFKGAWEATFPPAATRPQDFTDAAGNVQQAPMMRLSSSFSYAQTPDYQMVSLPYSGGYDMLVVLPTVGKTPAEAIASIDQAGWADTVSALTEQRGLVVLPKFKVQYQADLVAPLKELGVRFAFDNRKADFTNMLLDNGATLPAYIGDIVHKSYISVDENGTEAAAATAITMRALAVIASPNQPLPFTMIVDRPYFFAIRDTVKNVVLFEGVINDPTR